ncbi:MAG: hypothetical protein ABSH01_29205, partial [Terriglobia bacterium]
RFSLPIADWRLAIGDWRLKKWYSNFLRCQSAHHGGSIAKQKSGMWKRSLKSGIWNLKSEVKPWAFSDQQECPYVVTEG